MLLILLGAVLPLLIAPGLLFHFDTTPKTLALEFAAVAVLMKPQALALSLAELWSRRTGRWLVLIASLQFVWFGVATGFSSRPWFGVFGSTWRQFGLTTLLALMIVVVAVAGELCREPGRIALLLRSIACAGILASCYGILQYFDIDPFQNSAGYHHHAGDSVIVRPPGPMGHADFFGWWLVVGVFCAGTLAVSERGRWRTFGLTAMAMQVVAVIFTGTRAALLALLAGVIVSGFRPRTRHLIPAAVCLCLLGALLFSPAGDRLRARVQWSAEEPAGGARPLLWRDSLRMAAAKPLVGYGPEVFSAVFLTWQSDALARIYPDFHQESPHNVALDALTSAGLPGLALALAWGGLAVWSARRSRFRGPLGAAVAASAVASMFTAAILAPVLLTLLVIAILVAQDSRVAGNSPAKDIRPSTRQAGNWALRAVGVGLAAHSMILAAADFELAQFQRSPGVRTYERARRVRLPGAADDVYSSRVLATACAQISAGPVRLECSRAATQAAALATTTADDPANAWYNFAMFSAALNDWAGTDNALGSAMRIAPNWFKPHWARAKLLQMKGERDAAIPEAERAATLAADHYAEVNQTLEQLRK